MTITGGLAIYFVIWWVGLFAVLPWGVRSQHEDGEIVYGSDPGAPTKPRMLRIVIANTILASVVFAIFYFVYTRGLFSLDDIPFLPGRPNY